MFRFSPDCSRPARGGFTLWELVLALSVLAMLVGLTWPTVTRYVGEQQLKEDTLALRTQLGATRSRAIRNGVMFQFRFEPGGRQYIILPYERPVAMATASVGESAAAVVDPDLQVRTFQLAEGNRFEVNDPHDGPTMQSTVTTEKMTQDWLQMFGGSTALARVNWSPAIRFAADGTSDDVYFFVQDEDGRYQRIAVRGLTAVASIGPLLRERQM